MYVRPHVLATVRSWPLADIRLIEAGSAVLVSAFDPKRASATAIRPMKNVLLLGLFVAGQAMGQDGHEPPEWFVDPNVLACPPATVSTGDALVLTLGPGHGRELAIRRVEDNAWFFLVVGLPDDGEPQLMTPTEFEAISRVEIPASLVMRTWSAGGERQTVLSRPGKYEVYVSDNLESETGGHVCRFNYAGKRPASSGVLKSKLPAGVAQTLQTSASGQ